MKKSIHYVIDGARVVEDKAETKRALKRGAEAVKVTRIEYETGPTKAILVTLTKITKTKEV